MLYGWRVSRLVHSKATYKKYCQLLTLGGVKQEFPEYTDASYMCLGIRDINRDSLPYWSVVSGKIKLKNKHLSNTPNW
uniref:Uncharacterized protein n=1 Tax=viral metagenome TaxID=1070528 RepID=A0A6H1Z7L7_9ZZZZ